jgi:hypothetical protein
MQAAFDSLKKSKDEAEQGPWEVYNTVMSATSTLSYYEDWDDGEDEDWLS